MGQFSKPWEELNFSDNFIFCKVMKNKEICKRMLEILLGFKITEIRYIESEHAIDNYYNSRGIRLDVYVEDTDKIYNIEMQTSDYTDLLLRARYYQSSSDVSTTPRRTQFKNIRETFIIFICKDDPFGLGLPLYTEKKTFLESDEISYDDKTHKLFYNSSSFAQAENQDVRDVLEFIYTLQAKSSFTKILETSAAEAKLSTSFKDEYMYFEDILEDEKEQARAAGMAEGLAEGRAAGMAEGRATGLAEGRATGLAEGRATGLAEGQEKAARKLLKENISIEVIARCTGLTVEEVTKLKEQ